MEQKSAGRYTTDLHIIRNGIYTAQRYADGILRSHVIPYAAANGNSFLLIQYNARPHRAQLLDNMLEMKTLHHTVSSMLS